MNAFKYEPGRLDADEHHKSEIWTTTSSGLTIEKSKCWNKRNVCDSWLFGCLFRSYRRNPRDHIKFKNKVVWAWVIVPVNFECWTKPCTATIQQSARSRTVKAGSVSSWWSKRSIFAHTHALPRAPETGKTVCVSSLTKVISGADITSGQNRAASFYHWERLIWKVVYTICLYHVVPEDHGQNCMCTCSEIGLARCIIGPDRCIPPKWTLKLAALPVRETNSQGI